MNINKLLDVVKSPPGNLWTRPPCKYQVALNPKKPKPDPVKGRDPWPIRSKKFDTDVLDADWQLIKNHFSTRNDYYPKREMVNAMLWIANKKQSWSTLPTCFPGYKEVQQTARRWLVSGRFSSAAAVTGLNERTKQLLLTIKPNYR